MDNIHEYISSGILELYVYGALSPAESAEVSKVLKQYPEVKVEVEEIENSLLKLSESVAPYNPEHVLEKLKLKLSSNNPKVVPVKKSTTNWASYLGWAASLLFLIGLFVLFNRNNNLRADLQALQAEKAQMESQIANSRDHAEKAEQLLGVLRDKNIIKIPLAGQAVDPDAYATAYWDKNTNTTYIDAIDLPIPPRGMVYQVWSLKMTSLTPTSIGLLDKFEEDDNKIFELDNANLSEGFGITLEPEGGSETPTLERLYTLGTVSSS